MSERSDDPLAERTLDSRLVFEGVFLKLFVDHVQSADGHQGTREYLRHPGAVMIIPLLDAEHVLLERQFRYPLGRSIVEFPAGKIDPGEPPFECARRELLEETGLHRAPLELPRRPAQRDRVLRREDRDLPRRGPGAQRRAPRWTPARRSRCSRRRGGSCWSGCATAA